MSEGIRIRRDGVNVQFGQTLVSVPLGHGLDDVEALKDELIDMVDVLLGREPSPIESPYLALQEVATAYHARACEIEMQIFFGEQDNTIMRGSALYKFRTGPLATFISMSKRLADLGSRRMSQESLLYNQRLEGGSSS